MWTGYHMTENLHPVQSAQPRGQEDMTTSISCEKIARILIYYDVSHYILDSFSQSLCVCETASTIVLAVALTIFGKPVYFF
jgi:hypothetical protein